MGSNQNYGPFLGPLDTKCRIIFRSQKGSIILTTTHIDTDVDMDVDSDSFERMPAGTATP